MRLTERQSFADQIIGHVGSVGEIIVKHLPHAGGIQLHAFEHGRIDGKTELQGIDRIEQAFFIFLHVFVIGHRQSFESSQHSHQMAYDPAGFAADQFAHIRVFLLRHNARPGTMRIVQFNEGKLGRRPENQFLAQPGQMNHQKRGKRQELHDVVPVADRVHAVLVDFGKFQFFGNHPPVDRKCRSGQSAGAKRHDVATFPDSGQSVKITRQHLKISQQMMGKQYRLRPLQVSIARQDNFLVGCRHFDDRPLHVMDQPGDRQNRGFYVHVGIKRHLVVAAAGRMQLAADWSDPFGQPLFNIHVDIFQRDIKRKVACFDIRQDRLQSGNNLIRLSSG